MQSDLLKDRLFDLIFEAEPADFSFAEIVRRRWQSIAKPLGGLGAFEDIVCRIASVQKTENPTVEKRALAIFCADNGIVEEGVSQTDSSVTRIVYENMKRGMSSACKMAEIASCDVFPYDVGISPCGTKNFLKEDAMTFSGAIESIFRGIEIAGELSSRYDILATGEMGIGNTTTSSAVLASLLSLDASVVTGKGAGLSDSSLKHKIEVIRRGIEMRNVDKTDVLDVLHKVGGFDIASMCGFFIGGAIHHRPVIIDGLISAVSALCAVKLCPHVSDILIPSHVSSEPAGKIVLDALNLEPLVTAGMHLGEGTGCMTVLPMLDMALNVFRTMPTFDEISIEAYKTL